MVIPMHDASFISMIPKSDLVVLFDDLRSVLSAMSQADEIFDGRLDMNRFGSVIQSQVLPAMETFNEHFIPIDEAVRERLEKDPTPEFFGWLLDEWAEVVGFSCELPDYLFKADFSPEELAEIRDAIGGWTDRERFLLFGANWIRQVSSLLFAAAHEERSALLVILADLFAVVRTYSEVYASKCHGMASTVPGFIVP